MLIGLVGLGFAVYRRQKQDTGLAAAWPLAPPFRYKAPPNLPGFLFVKVCRRQVRFWHSAVPIDAGVVSSDNTDAGVLAPFRSH
jgi:hypothetical protein